MKPAFRDTVSAAGEGAIRSARKFGRIPVIHGDAGLQTLDLGVIERVVLQVRQAPPGFAQTGAEIGGAPRSAPADAGKLGCADVLVRMPRR